MTAPQLILVAAISDNGIIGRNGGLPWRLPADMKHFRRLTLGHTVLMGRKTFDS
ncbi:dihydrofolate reductase, partial [Acinetobacter baumannii]